MNDDIFNTEGFIIKDNNNNNQDTPVVNNDDIYNTDGFVIKNNNENNDNSNVNESTINPVINNEVTNQTESSNEDNNGFNLLNNNEPKKEKNYDEQIEFESDMVKGYIGDNYYRFNANKLNIYAFLLGGVYLVYRKKYAGILLFALFFTLFYNFYSNIFILGATILLYFLINYYIARSFNEKYLNQAYDNCMRINSEYNHKSDIEIIRICRAQGGVSGFFTIILTALIIAGNVYFGPIVKDKFNDIFNKSSDPKTTENSNKKDNSKGKEDALMSEAKSNVLDYIDSIEYYAGFVAASDGEELIGETYTKITSGDVSTITAALGDKLKGTAPTSGTVTIDEKGRVTNATVCMNNYTVVYETNNVTSVVKGCSETNGNVVSDTVQQPTDTTDNKKTDDTNNIQSNTTTTDNTSTTTPATDNTPSTEVQNNTGSLPSTTIQPNENKETVN